ncbi:hypothetical protein J5N97_017063 [Dioscorea zingiberensis]|uniref:J domain-containing protein n=1 Tax=Dioscorea zingiberensis TaxID=325984 RepID=A0A9D5CMI8_9LILI|nr:hypothetical protein J5N97_017063 [Dioscorea zingiberensis]
MGGSTFLSLSFNGVVLPTKEKFNTTISCKTRSMYMPLKTNYYKVLSLESETASVDEIKKAYRRLARRYHPDVCPPSKKEESTRMFIQLQLAYETLLNPVLRRIHDSELSVTETELKSSKGRWQAQLHELRERSNRRERQKESFTQA